MLIREEIAMRSDLMNNKISAQHLEIHLEAYPDVPILLFWDRIPWHQGRAIKKVFSRLNWIGLLDWVCLQLSFL